MSKGSRQRPYNKTQFDKNWESIFKKGDKDEIKKSSIPELPESTTVSR